MLRTIWRILTPTDQRRAVIVLALMAFGTALEAAGVALVFPLVRALGNEATLQSTLQAFRGTVLRNTVSPTAAGAIAGGLILAFYLLKNAFLTVATYLQSRFVFAAQSHVATRLFSAYLRAPWTLHLQRNPAELLRIITHDVSVLFGNVINPLCVLFVESGVTVAIIVVLVAVDPITSLAAFAGLGSVALAFQYVLKRKSDTLGRAHQQALGRMLQWVNQSVGGHREIRVLGRAAFFEDGFTATSLEVTEGSVYLAMVSQLPRFYLEALTVAALLLTVTVAWMRGDLAAGVLPKLALFAAATYRLMPAVNRMVSTTANVRYHRPCVATVAWDLDTLAGSGEPVEVDPEPLPFRDRIVLEAVSFQYPGAATSALREVALSIPKGASVAIEGPSGAGKSTLIDLLLGLLTPTAGRILVDGVDLHLSPARWQRNVGYVPQSIYLTDDSIRANVAFGLPPGLVEDTRVWAALRAAQLEEKVRSLPEGLNTTVGERGVRLSGGERQRLGVARALYGDPSVLVLDEATASLDSHTEAEVTRVVQALRGRKTLILVSHRASTLEACDLRFQLRGGVLVEPAHAMNVS